MKRLWFLLLIPALAVASYIPHLPKAGTFARMIPPDTVTITTGGTFYEAGEAFDNRATFGFTVSVGPPAGVMYIGATSRWFEIDWHHSTSGNSNGMNVEGGIAINGTVPDSTSVMGTFLKTSGEAQAYSGTLVVELDSADVVTLVISADDDGDVLIIDYLTTSIRPFYEQD